MTSFKSSPAAEVSGRRWPLLSPHCLYTSSLKALPRFTKHYGLDLKWFLKAHMEGLALTKAVLKWDLWGVTGYRQL